MAERKIGYGYANIEWLELEITNQAQEQVVKDALREVHVPGDRIDIGFRVYGYVPVGTATNYIE